MRSGTAIGFNKLIYCQSSQYSIFLLEGLYSEALGGAGLLKGVHHLRPSCSKGNSRP